MSYKLQLLPVMSCCLELVGSSPRVSLSQEEESEKRVCTERPRTSNCGRGTPLKSKSGQDEGIITQLLLFAGQGPSRTSCTALRVVLFFVSYFGVLSFCSIHPDQHALSFFLGLTSAFIPVEPSEKVPKCLRVARLYSVCLSFLTCDRRRARRVLT